MPNNNLEFTQDASLALNAIGDYGWGEEVTLLRLFLSLMDNTDFVATDFLIDWGAPIYDLREMIFYECERNPLGDTDKIINFKKDFKGYECISVHDLFLFILKNSAFITDLMKSYGFEYEQVISYLEDSLEFVFFDENMVEEKEFVKDENKNLDSFCKDLVQKHKDGKIDPVYGREEEIRQVIKVLCRKKKSNPVLVGEAGTGKSTIIYGLASRIAEGKVPDFLLDKKIYELDLFGMIAGTKYRGEFESRAKTILSELIESDKKAIIFIDEIHTIVGAGANSDDSGDLSNMLKPYLANGELVCVGATTTNEYSKYIEKDPALNRRFQKVVINEPNETECFQILKALKDSYCNYHGVKISDSLLKYIVEKSVLIKGRSFPDKAIDLLDESCSESLLSKINSGKGMPKEIKENIDRIDFLINSAIWGERSSERDFFMEEKEKIVSEFKNSNFIRVTKKYVDKAFEEILKSEGMKTGIGFGI